MMDPKIRNLIEALDTPSDTRAEAVIEKLVTIGNVAVPALIQSATNVEKPRAQKWSLLALGAIGDKNTAPILVEALTDKRMTVRLQALKGLTRMRYKKGAMPIAQLLKDKSGGIRVNALYALISLKDTANHSQIKMLLGDPQWNVRQIAATACEKLKIKSARVQLLNLSQSDTRQAVRVAAQKALNSF